MPAIFIYLIKLSCSLGIIWLFYRLVLHNLTFYTLNRWYLLGYTLLSFLIPLVDIGPIRNEDPALQPLIVRYIPVIDNAAPPAAVAAVASRATHWSLWSVLLFLLALGSCFFLLRFLLRFISLRHLRRNAQLVEDGPVRIFRVGHRIAPFSFGNAIYVNPGEHSEDEWEEIILHEYVHIQQRHTLDLLFGELLVIVGWFNPFAWLIRFSIRQNLEFIADRAVVEAGRDKKGYQYHLLKVVGQSRYRIANNFNFSSLKKRIIMMNKMKSARLHLLRFLFILPLLAILLVAFRDRITAFQSQKGLYVNAAGIVISMPDRKPMGDVVVKELLTGVQTTTDDRGYYKLHIPVKGDSVLVRVTYTKANYQSNLTQETFPGIKQSMGFCDVGFMTLRSDPSPGIYYVAQKEASPVDPGYSDALQGLKHIQTVDAQALMNMVKKGPAARLWPADTAARKPNATQVNTTQPHSARQDTTIPGPGSLDDAKALWIINGIPRPKGWNGKDSLRPDDIASVDVLKGEEAIRYFGDQGANGVIAIVTKSAKNAPPTMRIAAGGAPPLMVVDGIIKENGVGDLNPMYIESISVLKPEAAIPIYGDKGANGAVMIKTKKDAHPTIVAELKDSSGNPIKVIADTMTTSSGAKFYPRK